MHQLSLTTGTQSKYTCLPNPRQGIFQTKEGHSKCRRLVPIGSRTAATKQSLIQSKEAKARRPHHETEAMGSPRVELPSLVRSHLSSRPCPAHARVSGITTDHTVPTDPNPQSPKRYLHQHQHHDHDHNRKAPTSSPIRPFLRHPYGPAAIQHAMVIHLARQILLVPPTGELASPSNIFKSDKNEQ